jgi:hypothetical protein
MKYSIKISYDDLHDDCTRKWYYDGYLHRDDGPAIEYSVKMIQSKSFDHFCPYYIKGNRLTWDYVLTFIHPKEKNPNKNLTYNYNITY